MEELAAAASTKNVFQYIYWIDPDATASAALYIGSILILLAALQAK